MKSELGVRAALGAGRRRIVQQLGIESLILSPIGGSLGLLAGWGASRALAVLAEGAVELGQVSDTGLDVRVLGFTFILSCLTALLFGLVPAWQASRIDLQSSVKSQSRGTIGGKGPDRMRSTLVVAEVALVVVLLVGAGLLLRTVSNMTAVKLGFQPENGFHYANNRLWQPNGTRKPYRSDSGTGRVPARSDRGWNHSISSPSRDDQPGTVSFCRPVLALRPDEDRI